MGGELLNIIYTFFCQFLSPAELDFNFNDATYLLFQPFRNYDHITGSYFELLNYYQDSEGIAVELLSGYGLIAYVMTFVIMIILLLLLFKLFKWMFNLIFKLFRLN